MLELSVLVLKTVSCISLYCLVFAPIKLAHCLLVTVLMFNIVKPGQIVGTKTTLLLEAANECGLATSELYTLSKELSSIIHGAYWSGPYVKITGELPSKYVCFITSLCDKMDLRVDE